MGILQDSWITINNVIAKFLNLKNYLDFDKFILKFRQSSMGAFYEKGLVFLNVHFEKDQPLNHSKSWLL